VAEQVFPLPCARTNSPVTFPCRHRRRSSIFVFVSSPPLWQGMGTFCCVCETTGVAFFSRRVVKFWGVPHLRLLTRPGWTFPFPPCLTPVSSPVFPRKNFGEPPFLPGFPPSATAPIPVVLSPLTPARGPSGRQKRAQPGEAPFLPSLFWRTTARHFHIGVTRLRPSPSFFFDARKACLATTG